MVSTRKVARQPQAIPRPEVDFITLIISSYSSTVYCLLYGRQLMSSCFSVSDFSKSDPSEQFIIGQNEASRNGSMGRESGLETQSSFNLLCHGQGLGLSTFDVLPLIHTIMTESNEGLRFWTHQLVAISSTLASPR